MIDTYFLDRDGTPLAGKVPLQVRFSGGGDFDSVRAEANGILQHFIQQARQSLADTHRIRYALPGKGEMLVTSIFGVMTVDIVLPPAPEEGGPFYGGILISPHVITGDESAYLSLAGNPTPWAVPAQIKTQGDLPGRPAVPGTGDASTEWLVVQIAGDMPLTGDPLASGAVAMYRIADPLFGVFCEVAEPGHYAVSTIDGSAFFMCGRQLDHVPPMPGGLPALTRSSEAGGGPSPSRIRTIGMQPASFVDAHAAEGIIVFALVNQLWALNTRERTEFTPAPWRLLAEVSMPRTYPGDYLPNEFGAVFSVAVAGGNYTLTCSGTNGVGACSGFTVSINALGTMSGTLELVDSGFRASAAHSQTVSFTGSYSRPEDTLVDSWDMPLVDNFVYGHTENTFVGGPDDGLVTTAETKLDTDNALGDIKYVAYKALGLAEEHTLYVEVTGPTPATVPDTLLGGLMPRRAEPYSRQFLETGETQCLLARMDYRLKGAAPRYRLARFDSEKEYTFVPGPDEYDETSSSSTTVYTPTPGKYTALAQQDVLTSGGAWVPGHDTSATETLWFMTVASFLDYYEAAYADYVSIDTTWSSGQDRFAVRGELQAISSDVEVAYKLGELYMNTREINDRVFYGTTLERAPPYEANINETFVRSGPHLSMQRYTHDFDINERLTFPGITPFPQIEEEPFVVPGDLPELDDDLSYPDFAPGYEEGTYPERRAWAPSGLDTGGMFDGEFICRYPKRAAIFDTREHYEVQDTFVGSLLGRSFTSTRTRDAGELVANEFQAHMLPTNVDTFVISSDAPDVEKTDDRLSEAGATYERDPYLRYAWTARDWHCDTLGWRRDAGRTGSWFIEDRPLRRFANNGECALLRETADRVEASHTLYRAGGATVMTFPDLLSFYPLRSTHGSMSLTTNIVNVAAPYLQHDLVYLDKRYPDLDVCDSIGIPQTGGLGGTTYNVDEGDTFFFDTECLPRREWMPKGPYREGWTPNRPQLLVGYWGRDVNGGDRDPLFPVPGYWVPNPEEDPPEGEEYIHVPHITEASETAYDLTRPEVGFSPDFSGGMFLASPRGAEFYELQARNFLGDIGTAFDRLYVDNRTGGFITQVLWSGNGGRICETYIGNRTGVVPFRPIFDAWLAQGGGAPADGTKVAIVRPSTAIGGPAAGPIDAQLVSLL